MYLSFQEVSTELYLIKSAAMCRTFGPWVVIMLTSSFDPFYHFDKRIMPKSPEEHRIQACWFIFMTPIELLAIPQKSLDRALFLYARFYRVALELL